MDYKKESNQSDFWFDPLVMPMCRVISCVVGRGCLLWSVHPHLEPDILALWSQVGLRKHHYEQSKFRWWNSSWSISNPKRWCCESASLTMENSAVATRLEKVCFHSNPKERQCQRMLKLLHNCTQTPRLRSGGCAGTGGPRGATPRSRSGGAVVRRYPLSKVRSSGCALLEQPWRDTHIQGNLFI